MVLYRKRSFYERGTIAQKSNLKKESVVGKFKIKEVEAPITGILCGICKGQVVAGVAIPVGENDLPIPDAKVDTGTYCSQCGNVYRPAVVWRNKEALNGRR